MCIYVNILSIPGVLPSLDIVLAARHAPWEERRAKRHWLLRVSPRR